MSNAGAPPVIPTQFQIVDTGIADQKWQRIFTIIWASAVGLIVVLSLPKLFTAVRNGNTLKSIVGITEDWNRKRYQALSVRKHKARRYRRVEVVLNKIASLFFWCIPGLELNLGQLIVIIGYLTTLVVCIVTDAALVTNANRAGYMVLAQLPVVFLFATRNSILSLLLGPGHGYEKLNFVHKWSGRGIFFSGLLHGSLWIRDHLLHNAPILGPQKETSGVAAFGVLCVLVLVSLRPFRRMFYEVFHIIHNLTFMAFFIVVCYHTSYATPWIFPPLGFYGLDLLMRMFRLRVKDAILTPPDKQMTLIHVHDCTDGWTAGQHIRLRVFFSGRVFETHPLTMFTAPPEITCVTSFPQGINLGVRVMGDWTKAINDYATQTVQELQALGEEVCDDDSDVKKTDEEKAGILAKVAESSTKRTVFKSPPPDVPVQVMVEGPYGGCSIDLGDYENVLLFAGGGGVTFTLGMLDNIVGRCVKLGRSRGEITKRVEFTWCIKSFGAIDWFAPALMDIATMAASSDLNLHISIYVTCLCNPEAVPPIPNCDVTIVRPSIYKVLLDLATPPASRDPTATAKTHLESTPTTPTTSGIETVPREDAPTAHARLSTLSTQSQTSSSGGIKDSEAVVPTFRTDAGSENKGLPWIGLEGGLAVCASGPESLTREAANAVARLKQFSGRAEDVGIVGLHTEVFSL